MSYESWFDVTENSTLLAICARRLIRNIGIGATVWGAINIVVGLHAIQETLINAGILILGAIMLATGLQALRNPFVVPREFVADLISQPDARNLKMLIRHPLGKLRYSFDKKNSEKLRAWLTSPDPTATGA